MDPRWDQGVVPNPERKKKLNIYQKQIEDKVIFKTWTKHTQKGACCSGLLLGVFYIQSNIARG